MARDQAAAARTVQTRSTLGSQRDYQKRPDHGRELAGDGRWNPHRIDDVRSATTFNTITSIERLTKITALKRILLVLENDLQAIVRACNSAK